MTRAEWIRIMERNDPDVHLLMGQREAALLMLLVITENWNQYERDDCANKAIIAYEQRLKGSNQAEFIPVLGPGFRDLCDLFRKNCQLDD